MPHTFHDSHAHLNDEQFDGDLPEVLGRSRQAGITRVINVGYDVASSVKAWNKLPFMICCPAR